jgi:hypothetical protein
MRAVSKRQTAARVAVGCRRRSRSRPARSRSSGAPLARAAGDLCVATTQPSTSRQELQDARRYPATVMPPQYGKGRRDGYRDTLTRQCSNSAETQWLASAGVAITPRPRADGVAGTDSAVRSASMGVERLILHVVKPFTERVIGGGRLFRVWRRSGPIRALPTALPECFGQELVAAGADRPLRFAECHS